MRIIAGSRRGKKLVEYYSPQTRPTTDRVKENVFNLLGNLVDWSQVRVLDLFAGTGAYGIECLSRGAKFVRFNDVDSQAIKVIRQNLGNIWTNCQVTQLDFRDVPLDGYDLIFLDPPYASDFGAVVIDKVKHGLIVLETDVSFEHPAVIISRQYGRARIYILKK